MATIGAREFNQDVSAAKRAAIEGPVTITERGRPSHVLLSFADYERLVGAPTDLVAWLAAPEGESEDVAMDDLDRPLQIDLRIPEL